MRILLSFHHLPNLIYFLLDFMSNDGLPIYPAFLGSVCMGHLSAIVLVLSIRVWFVWDQDAVVCGTGWQKHCGGDEFSHPVCPAP